MGICVWLALVETILADVFGLVFLIPPTRAMVRRLGRAYFTRRFMVGGRLSGETAKPLRSGRGKRRRVKLKAKAFGVGARARALVKLKLPSQLRRPLARMGKLPLRLTARVTDQAGNTRIVKKSVSPTLKR
jgi:hypothetical protein